MIIYVRVTPRSQLTRRHRCATEFTADWKQIDVDAATRAALEEDPYLEVTETPTVKVEVPLGGQPAAVAAQTKDPHNPESEANQDNADSAKGIGQAGTESAAAASGETNTGTAEAETSSQAAASQLSDADLNNAIKAAISQLDHAAPDNWLADGKPNTKALSTALGFQVTASQRDAAWAEMQPVQG